MYKRLNDHTVELDDVRGSKIFVNENIELERSAIEEAKVFSTIDGIEHLSFTPDFHKGAGTPIGTVALIDRVYPRVVGSDIGCGMRLDKLNIKTIDIEEDLKDRLRGSFFEGKREIFNKNRENILRYGLGAVDELYGSTADIIKNMEHRTYQGFVGLGDISDVLSPYIKLAGDRDNILACAGGGNHFIEIQVVDEVVDRRKAYEFGLKKDDLCVMVHTGSLDNGHQVANHFKDLAKHELTSKHPEHGYFPLSDKSSLEYFVASSNAANFATVNRALLAACMAEVLDTSLSSIYDSPHNLVTKQDNRYLHNKGSCSAKLDEIVIIPGSMGTRSCVCVGLEFAGTNASSPHGAGRVLNRGSSRKNIDSLHDLQIVTKIDPRKTRSDVADEVMKDLSEESPRSYKDIGEVIKSVEMAGIAKPVLWLKPLLTIKG